MTNLPDCATNRPTYAPDRRPRLRDAGRVVMAGEGLSDAGCPMARWRLGS